MTQNRAATFSLRDQSLELFPERALHWVEASTVVVADVHFGKTATFRAHGVALPAGSTQDNLRRLTAVLTATGAGRLLILGDLLHAKLGRAPAVLEQVAAWRNDFQSLAVDLVLGNHDHHAGLPPASWKMRCVDRLRERPFVWQHHPAEANDGYVIAGHVHPAVMLRSSGDRLTLPCFYFSKTYALLPAFGDFTGFGVVRPKASDSVFVLAGDEIVPFTG